MNATISYFDIEIILDCYLGKDDLLVSLSLEPDQMFSETNFASKRDMFDYEHYLILVLEQVADKTPINVTIKQNSIEATIYSYKNLEDVDITNLFMAFKNLDMIYLGVPMEDTAFAHKTI